MKNLISPIQYALDCMKFRDGLSYYSQTKCQTTLTDQGFRIYRPPNSNGTTYNDNPVWGGLRLTINDIYPLVQGRTYIIKFHVKGKSSNAPTTVGFSNQMGWGGGGLSPSPSAVSYIYTPANFNGEMDCYYKFTVSDAVYKVCTSTYSVFTAGETYLSYKDFQFGFDYRDTGELGTDLYLSNFRMYDITNGDEHTLDIKQTGIMNCSALEQGDQFSVYQNDITVHDNILKNTLFTSNPSTYATIDPNKTFNGLPAIKISQSGNESNVYRGYSQSIQTLRAGDVVTASVWIYREKDSTFDGGYEMRLYQYHNDGTSTNWTGFAPSTSGWPENKWFKVQRTYVLDSNLDYPVFSLNVVKNGTYWFAAPKVEYGRQATPWCPAVNEAFGGISFNLENPIECNTFYEY